ncbi:unnamed protein product [Oppiella nova]|uniref:Uncharacterized protein n=1 Tax=Oppiella nova TaxID=334625 RepID=A0A7R9LGX9_9ACAR|nr:unnamed protein product [Oppiella nova]CAG2162845.1 unnamed protein product [Oppiella nova]
MAYAGKARNSTINCVAFDGNNILYGCNAQRYLNGSNTYPIKDIMGRDVDNEDLIRLIFTDTTHASVDLNVESLFALQVLEMKSRAETQFENYIQNVLFIVPTYYSIRQVQAVKDSAKIAGVEHAHILSHMSAVAIDFCFNPDKYNRDINLHNVLVLILNRSNCDLALIEYTDHSARYKAYEEI